MIDDLDSTLQRLLERDLPAELVSENAPTQVSITFAAPGAEFPPNGVNLPAIDLFLYDVRENQGLHSNEMLVNHPASGKTTKTHSPIYVDLSYLITAWNSNDSTIADEHKILSAVLDVLIRYPVIPKDVLPTNPKSPLSQLENHLVVSALRPGHLQSIAEFWQVLGGKPKAALHYTVTVPVVMPQGEPSASVKEARLYIDQMTKDDENKSDEKQIASTGEIILVEEHKLYQNK